VGGETVAVAEGGTESILDRLTQAMNSRDIDAFVALFAEDYDSQQPAHPDRAFRGRDQVRANWSEIFAAVPDFQADLIAAAGAGATVWSEWRWHGTHADGTRLEMAGVIVFGVRDGLFDWARLYVEQVEHDGAGIAAAVNKMSGAA
jgi:ketosteroid isomerase-like protein